MASRLNLDLPDELANDLTAWAVVKKRSRNLLVCEILADWLELTEAERENRVREAARRRAVNRVRAAAGRVNPVTGIRPKPR